MAIIYTIPGLGCTAELFQNIKINGYQLKVLTWPETKNVKSLEEYAKLFLHQINTNKPVILMGVSFGGMLCSELSNHIKTKEVILISTCKTKLQFPLLLKVLKYFPAYLLVNNFLYTRAGVLKRTLLGYNDYYSDLFHKMMCSMNKNYFKQCIHLIVNWTRIQTKETVIQIHGSGDKLMAIKKINPNYVIEGGSHAMIITRADEINNILSNILNATN